MIEVVTGAGTSRAEVLQLAEALATAAAGATAGATEGGAGSRPGESQTAVVRLHPVLDLIAAEAGVGADEEVSVGGDGVVIGSAEVRELRTETAPGSGLSGVVRTAHSGLLLGRRVLIGSPAWLEAQGAGPVDPDLARTYADAEAAGAPALLLAWSGTARAVLRLRD